MKMHGTLDDRLAVLAQIQNFLNDIKPLLGDDRYKQQVAQFRQDAEQHRQDALDWEDRWSAAITKADRAQDRLNLLRQGMEQIANDESLRTYTGDGLVRRLRDLLDEVFPRPRAKPLSSSKPPDVACAEEEIKPLKTPVTEQEARTFFLNEAYTGVRRKRRSALGVKLTSQTRLIPKVIPKAKPPSPKPKRSRKKRT